MTAAGEQWQASIAGATSSNKNSNSPTGTPTGIPTRTPQELQHGIPRELQQGIPTRTPTVTPKGTPTRNPQELQQVCESFAAAARDKRSAHRNVIIFAFVEVQTTFLKLKARHVAIFMRQLKERSYVPKNDGKTVETRFGTTCRDGCSHSAFVKTMKINGVSKHVAELARRRCLSSSSER